MLYKLINQFRKNLINKIFNNLIKNIKVLENLLINQIINNKKLNKLLKDRQVQENLYYKNKPKLT